MNALISIGAPEKIDEKNCIAEKIIFVISPLGRLRGESGENEDQSRSGGKVG